MSPRANSCAAEGLDGKPNMDAEYLCIRIVDTLLREDVRECVTRSEVVGTESLPKGMATPLAIEQRWLRITHFGDGRLWIPVSPDGFMQQWRLARLPLIWCLGDRCRNLCDVGDILACFSHGLDDQGGIGFSEFEREFRVALEHRRVCEAERVRWFDWWRATKGDARGTDMDGWQERLLHYERLASFLDHPFYPTARAKTGFSPEDLPRYAPEFRPSFDLNWLAVPRELYCQSGERLPPGWPDFSHVGLSQSLARSHALVPVHPLVWRCGLDQFLRDSGSAMNVVRAPASALPVTPTLSVRTLMLNESPSWHLKLPLTIRTLGARNIRTIKPSTISDGHRIQALLGAIAEREPELRGRLLLTEEDTGAHVANQAFLGFILRRYPQELLEDATLVPIAALAARTPLGNTVVEELAERFFKGDVQSFFNGYIELTLKVHLLLWLRYGIALESNQQNSVLVLDDSGLRLLLKDNDAPRVHRDYLACRWPELAPHVADLQDTRIVVQGDLPLAQMFTTITLQLNIAVLVETIARLRREPPTAMYAQVRRHLERILLELRDQGEDVSLAKRVLLEDRWLYVKYLLVAATLADKQVTGATDVNKHYGRSAPNFLLER